MGVNVASINADRWRAREATGSSHGRVGGVHVLDRRSRRDGLDDVREEAARHVVVRAALEPQELDAVWSWHGLAIVHFSVRTTRRTTRPSVTPGPRGAPGRGPLATIAVLPGRSLRGPGDPDARGRRRAGLTAGPLPGPPPGAGTIRTRHVVQRPSSSRLIRRRHRLGAGGAPPVLPLVSLLGCDGRVRGKHLGAQTTP
jgi:hypothetical protein